MCCVLSNKTIYGNCLYWCKGKYIHDFDGATLRLKATVPDRRVWLPTPVCVIVVVRLSKALKDAHSKGPSNCPENRVCLAILQTGGLPPSPPPRTIRLWLWTWSVMNRSVMNVVCSNGLLWTGMFWKETMLCLLFFLAYILFLRIELNSLVVSHC